MSSTLLNQPWKCEMGVKSKESIAEKARRIYEDKLRAELEEHAMNKFVVMKPLSGDHFLGDTLSDEIGATRTKHPGRLAHAMRVGRKAAGPKRSSLPHRTKIRIRRQKARSSRYVRFRFRISSRITLQSCEMTGTMTRPQVC